MNLLPIVNTEVKMPKKMLDALTLFETYCVVSNISSVTYQSVIDYLTSHYGIELSQHFKPEYLFSTQDFLASQP
jgi:hypothetical protein